MAIPGPFLWTNMLSLSPTAFTVDQLARLRRAAPAFDQMGIALVDIAKKSTLAYAFNFHKTGFAASLPKVVVMYAAFYLQDRLKTIRGQFGTMTLAQVETMLRKEWGPTIKSTVPRNVGDFPDITAIFGSTNFEFKDSFQEKLKAMIQASDNWAAGSCIHRIGYDYINAALTFGGLFSAADKSGFWLAGDYIPDTHKSNRDGVRMPGVKSTQAASAKAAALLLANLARDELISAGASAGMKAVMNNAASWVRDEIQSLHPGASVFGKVGLAQGTTHDCAIVKYADIHYVVVTLFANHALEPLFDELDRIAQQLFLLRKVGEALRSVVHP